VGFFIGQRRAWSRELEVGGEIQTTDDGGQKMIADCGFKSKELGDRKIIRH
jgi:hypothetical protein